MVKCTHLLHNQLLIIRQSLGVGASGINLHRDSFQIQIILCGIGISRSLGKGFHAQDIGDHLRLLRLLIKIAAEPGQNIRVEVGHNAGIAAGAVLQGIQQGLLCFSLLSYRNFYHNFSDFSGTVDSRHMRVVREEDAE